jgi:hypothetical protein
LLHAFIIIKMLTVYNVCLAQHTNKDFSNLDLIVGKWLMKTSKGNIYETWQKVNDTTLKSKSYKVNGKDTIMLEQADLVKTGDKIMYIPTVNGQNDERPIAFTLIKVENDTYTFENKEHDFPQRIFYALPKNNIMHAWIEGNINGEFKRSNYYYKKVF